MSQTFQGLKKMKKLILLFSNDAKLFLIKVTIMLCEYNKLYIILNNLLTLQK